MSHPPYPVHDDEIDLFELAENLWQQKWMIISITAVITLIATAAAFMIPPTYKSEAIISETSAAALAPINRFSASQTPSYTISGTQQEQSDQNSSSQQIQPTHNIYAVYLEDDSLTPEKSFKLFYKALTSADTIEAVFRDSNYVQMRSGANSLGEQNTAALYDELRNNIKIKLIKSDVPRISVTLTSHDPAMAATIINDYLIPLATQKVIEDEEQAITAELNREKITLMNDIQVIEQRYINTNLNRQNQLKQAIAMAEAGSITKPQLNNISGNDSPQYLFLLGTDTLRAELAQTQSTLNHYRSITRTGQSNSNTPLIPGVAEKFYRFQQLDGIKPDFSNSAPVRIEQHARVPFTPEKPNKKMVIAVGLMLGGMLSVFIALIRIAIQKRKSRIQVATLSVEIPKVKSKTPA
ncbi:hypothetical protein GCM10023116_07320 [Kistimonas scapharcae]|uniref:Polysaccharide chain length determinant N-terminal domain-containing protein n=1 Tax=Kistimonas scapharcae TaxID=1036133 RepID=A0ABP8UX17_9GAMM